MIDKIKGALAVAALTVTAIINLGLGTVTAFASENKYVACFADGEEHCGRHDKYFPAGTPTHPTPDQMAQSICRYRTPSGEEKISAYRIIQQFVGPQGCCGMLILEVTCLDP